jgi:predicted peroxiredoxin
MTHVPPLEPLAALTADFQKRGGTIWACPPCTESRGHDQADLLGVVAIVGAGAMHARSKKGRRRCRFEGGFRYGEIKVAAGK